METLSVATRSRCEMRDITAQVRELVARGRRQGRRTVPCCFSRRTPPAA